MLYINRTLNLNPRGSFKSCFLLGPRQTGKSTLLSHQYPEAKEINLLQTDKMLKYSTDPSLLRKENLTFKGIILIDEIQKMPLLLDEVQWLMDKCQIQFILTGSSARKLRRGGVNLLGGRVRTFHLHPLTYWELKDNKFNLMRALNVGLIPSIYFSDLPKKDIKAYSGDYLQQEIISEGLSRNVPAFSRFLEVSALLNGQMINYQKISDQSSVAKSTVIEYFHILKDTLVAFEVLPWKKSVIRKPIQTPKYYFFDVGVVRSLQKRDHLKLNSPDLGEAFEAWIAHELKSYLDYFHDGEELFYWRTTSQFEVDFILLDKIGIEVKAKSKFSREDFKGLTALQEEKLLDHYVLIGMHEEPFTEGKIKVLPWSHFLKKLYLGEFLN